MTRIFLHPGFHKTGTKSVQEFLRRNAAIIRHRAEFLLPEDVRDISRLGFWYQDFPDAQMLTQLQTAFADLLRPPVRGNRDLIISAENLLGRMPDGQGDQPYPAAIHLLTALVMTLQAMPGVDHITVYLSVRAQDDWARSLYGHQAMKTAKNDLTEDMASFSARLAQAPLADEARRICDAVPQVDGMVQDIASLSTAPFGIAQPLVDFLALAPDQLAQLQLPGHVHRSADPQLVAQLVALNRGDLRGTALTQAKRALIRGNVLAGTDMRGNPR